MTSILYTNTMFARDTCTSVYVPGLDFNPELVNLDGGDNFIQILLLIPFFIFN